MIQKYPSLSYKILANCAGAAMSNFPFDRPREVLLSLLSAPFWQVAAAQHHERDIFW
jgi:hypothetical protein